jgi:dihydrolipoamide dehydrogenase
MDGEVETLNADAMLVATGRTPKVSELALEAGGIELDPQTGGPKVDGELRTTNPHVFAIGDALGRQLYTHVANHEGPYAAKNALLDAHLVPDFYDEVPGAVFTDPELATVGLRAEEARERGLDVVQNTYPMARNGKARAIGKEEGFVRMVCERHTRRIVGATLVCHDAANALQEILVAMAGDGTIGAIRKAVHTHPTIVEAVNACARELESQLAASH